MSRNVVVGAGVGAIGGAIVGAVVSSVIQSMIPNPSEAFGEIADLPAFPSGERVDDGIERLRGLT
jgi:hypothetical protein